MSAQSGIVASTKLLDAFKDFDGDALVVKISADSSTLVPDESFKSDCKSPLSLPSTFELLHRHLKTLYPEPAYAVIPLQAQNGSFMFISFISDEAPIRQKMLYASTKNQLVTELGLGKFLKSHSFSWSELSEVSYDHYMYELKSNRVAQQPEPLSAALLADIESFQSLSVSSNQGPKKLASMHAGGASSKLLFKIDPSLESAIDSLASNATGNTLILCYVEISTETLKLASVCTNVKASALIDTLETETKLSANPYYALYNYMPHKVAFIYACPSGSKVKDRMVCAASKTSFVTWLNDIFKGSDSKIDLSIEIGDFAELELSQFEMPHAESTVETTPSSLKLSKPKGPRRR